MNCPNCKNKLNETNASGILTYTCKSCSGIWITYKAIRLLLTLEKSSFDIKDLLGNSSIDQSTRECAKCANQSLNIIETNNIEIDICSKCYGIFFDKNEIEMILPKTHKKDQEISSVVATEGLFWVIAGFIGGGGC